MTNKIFFFALFLFTLNIISAHAQTDSTQNKVIKRTYPGIKGYTQLFTEIKAVLFIALLFPARYGSTLAPSYT